jgi:hypothetical protein
LPFTRYRSQSFGNLFEMRTAASSSVPFLRENKKNTPSAGKPPQVTTNYEHPKIPTIKNFCAEPSRCRGAHRSSEKDDS